MSHYVVAPGCCCASHSGCLEGWSMDVSALSLVPSSLVGWLASEGDDQPWTRLLCFHGTLGTALGLGRWLALFRLIWPQPVILCGTGGCPWGSPGCCRVDVWCTSLWSWSQTAVLCFVLKTSDGQQSRLRRLKNGVPQGSVLAPLLFNIYIHNLPDTISRKYGYADDLAILAVHWEWKKIELLLSTHADV